MMMASDFPLHFSAICYPHATRWRRVANNLRLTLWERSNTESPSSSQYVSSLILFSRAEFPNGMTHILGEITLSRWDLWNGASYFILSILILP